MWASVDKAQNRLKKPRLLATAWSCLLKSYVYKSKMSSLFAAQAENGVVTRWIRLKVSWVRKSVESVAPAVVALLAAFFVWWMLLR
jgi:hypothetical protein